MRIRDLSRLGLLGRLGAFLFPLTIIILTCAASALAQTPSAQELDAWHRQMRQTSPLQGQAPLSQGGCFSSTYPNTQWQQVQCVTPPLRPYPPARGQRANTVGHGNDVTAQVTTGLIGEVTGSFDSVVGALSETGQVNDTGPQVANTFSLQINSNTFHGAPACSGAAEPSDCMGWQQFVYSNAGTLVMQYWLLNYYAECPLNWYSDGGGDCYENGFNAVGGIPPQDITNLANMSLTGSAVAGDMDLVSLAVGTTMYAALNPDSAVDLANYWNVAEFNVFGDCCDSQANFIKGTILLVRTEVANGKVVPPSCVAGGFTGETNNLNFGGAPVASRGLYPAVVFAETTLGGSSPCEAATEVSSATIAGSHDFNADGHSDILWRDTSGNMAIWEMQGKNIINANSAGLGGVATTWSIVGQRDFNGDFNADLLWHDTAGNLAIWEMDGTTILNPNSAGLGAVSTDWSIVGTGDFNGDGMADILWRNTTTGDLAIWEMNGTTILNPSAAGVGNVATNWSVVGVGDFNGDGKADILWKNNNNGNLAIYLMNGTTVTSANTFSNLGAFSVVGIGDFNGDGMSDILLRDGSGDIAIWEMNGTTIINSDIAYVGNLSTSWSVSLVGDFNDDGYSDILWRDTAGDIAIWYMNGTTLSSGAGLGTIPTTFAIQGTNAD
jgi:hypothetical protein